VNAPPPLIATESVHIRQTPQVGVGAGLPGHGRIDDIELLRAFAILFTLYVHLPFNLITWTSPTLDHVSAYFGFSGGVDLFFAVSGFVITRSLLPQLEHAASSLAFINTAIAFWVRRAWRILPSAWLWLAVILALTVIFNRSGAFGQFHTNFEGAIAALMNFANIRDGELFRIAPIGSTAPYWSLSLEEQFYLLLPALAFFFRRRLPVVLAFYVLIGLFVPRQAWGAIFSFTRTEALLLGVLLAFWSRNPGYRLFEPEPLKSNWFARFLVVSLLLLCLASLQPGWRTIVFFAPGLIAIVSAALVFLASYDQDYLWKKSWLKRIMMWIGARSYAMYLIHMPAYLATREIWWRIEPAGTVFDGRFALRYLVTAGLLIVIFSEINYRLVEMPLRERGAGIAKRLTQRALIA
jgi:peptidoglycan/LPS O-acetylase OafA/YrhL